MNYVEVVEQSNLVSEAERARLISRALGRFYTPAAIGRELSASVWEVARRSLRPIMRIGDPFCGDGRLIVWLLECAAKDSSDTTRFVIDLWDYDRSAVENAAILVSRAADHLSLDVEIQTYVGDTYARALEKTDHFDVVVTNPPWDVIKPDERELRQLSVEDSALYIEGLRERDRFLAENYPLSQPSRKFSGWGTNLARCGSELALRLTRNSGVCGVVSPASLFADQVSAVLREWLFGEHKLSRLSFFPAEARLFENVDQPSVSYVVTKQKADQSPFHLSVYDNSGVQIATHAVAIPHEDLGRGGYVLPILFGPGPLALLPKFASMPTFSDLERDPNIGLWAGRELDETRHSTYLASEGRYLFVKGRMIDRFQFCEHPTRWVRCDGPRIPISADFVRIGWRDVSRPNQKRRMKATLIPAGWVTGNSLNVAYFREPDAQRTAAFLGFVNSFVFEYQVRAYLATAHMSLGTVRRVRLPILTAADTARLSEVVNECLSGSEINMQRSEVLVAKLYGLERHEFESVLHSFPKVTDQEIEQLIHLW